MLVTLAASNNPHPLIRTIIGVTLVGCFFGLVGVAVYTRYRRRQGISGQLKAKDRLDRFSWPKPEVAK